MDNVVCVVNDDGDYVLVAPVTRGTLLVSVPTEVTNECSNPALCLSSYAHSTGASADTNFVMIVDQVLPPSYTLPERWTGRIRRSDIGDFVTDMLDAVSTGLQSANTMLIRTADGAFYQAASRPISAGNTLKRYARVLEHLMPLLEALPVSSSIFVETVLQRVLPLELEIMTNWQLPIFGPVAWKRQLPPVIVLERDRLVCPYENNVEPTVDECVNYLFRVYGEETDAGNAQSRLRARLRREEDSSEDVEIPDDEDADY